MAKRWKEIARLTLEGSSFTDQAVRLPALQEVLTFQEIITETAAGLWKAEHPQAGRLPDNFKETTILRLKKVGSESACLFIEGQLEEPETSGLSRQAEPPRGAIERAVEIVSLAIERVHDDRPPPEGLPKDIIPLLGRWGETLKADEALGIQATGRRKVTYTQRERARLVVLQEGRYGDNVDMVGTVLAADVKKRRFVLYRDADDSRGVEVKEFSPHQEAVVTEALKEHEKRRLRVIGRGQFERPAGNLVAISSVDDLIPLPTGEIPFDPNARPIWEELLEIASDIPDTELDNLPNDAAENLDHYLYGSPKR
jgi:hypothetical protein